MERLPNLPDAAGGPAVVAFLLLGDSVYWNSSTPLDAHQRQPARRQQEVDGVDGLARQSEYYRGTHTARERMTTHACSRRSFLSSGMGIAVGASLAPALAASQRSDLSSLTLSEASELLASRTVSAVELTSARTLRCVRPPRTSPPCRWHRQARRASTGEPSTESAAATRPRPACRRRTPAGRLQRRH